MKPDAKQAVFWYAAASLQNHTEALFLLARCHDEGWGVPANLREGSHFFVARLKVDGLRHKYDWRKSYDNLNEALATKRNPTNG